MAVDKILIQYEADISALQNKLKRVERSLGLIEVSARKSGKSIKINADIAAGSLADLEDGLKKINEELKRTTDPKALKELGKSFKEQSKLVDESRKNIQKLTGESDKRFKKLQSTILKIGGAIGIAFAADKLVRFGVEAVQLAAKAEGIKRAFDELDEPTLLDDLREATQGTVSDLNLMQNAVQAKNFKVPLDDLAKFFQFATQRAASTGESVDKLVQSIVLGIGRKSIRVIDNLGISASELQEEVRKTGDFAKGVGIIIDRELGKAGDTTLTAAQQFSQMNAAIENLKVEFGEAVLSGLKPFFGIIQSLLTGNIIKDLGKQIDKLTGSVGDLNEEFTKLTGEQIDKIEVSTEFLRLQNEQLSKGIILTEEQIQGFKEEAQAIVDRRNKAKKEADDAAAARKKTIAELRQLLSAEKSLIDKQSERSNIIPIQRNIARLEAQIAALLGEETEAQKKLRLEEEKRLKAAEKAAKEAEKLEEARLKLVEKNAEDIFNRNQKAAIELSEFEEQIRIDGIEDTRKQADAQIELEIEKGKTLAQVSNATGSELELIEAETAQKIVEINKKADEDIETSREERVDNTIEKLRQVVNIASEISGLLTAIDDKELEDLKENNEKKLEALTASQEAQQEQLEFELDNREITEQEAENKRLEQEAAFAAQEKNLRDQQEREEKEIARKKAIREKLIAVFDIGIDTAAAVIKSFRVSPETFGLPFSAFAAAAGALQLATVLATPIPGFKKGKVDIDGAGTSTSDSILARISKHESVINAKATKEYKGALEAANDHRLDDYINKNYVLPALKAKAGMDADSSLYDDYGLKNKVSGVTKQSRRNTDRIIRAIRDNDQQFQNYVSW